MTTDLVITEKYTKTIYRILTFSQTAGWCFLQGLLQCVYMRLYVIYMYNHISRNMMIISITEDPTYHNTPY